MRNKIFIEIDIIKRKRNVAWGKIVNVNKTTEKEGARAILNH